MSTTLLCASIVSPNSMSGIVCVCPFTLKLHFATVDVPFPVSVDVYFEYAYIDSIMATISANANTTTAPLFLLFTFVV